MKEKRGPSSQSKWGCLGLFAVVLMSCSLMWWFAIINPYTTPTRYSPGIRSWDSETQTLSFLLNTFDAYKLDKEGHLTCTSRLSDFKERGQSLTQAQYIILEQHYGKI